MWVDSRFQNSQNSYIEKSSLKISQFPSGKFKHNVSRCGSW